MGRKVGQEQKLKKDGFFRRMKRWARAEKWGRVDQERPVGGDGKVHASRPHVGPLWVAGGMGLVWTTAPAGLGVVRCVCHWQYPLARSPGGGRGSGACQGAERAKGLSLPPCGSARSHWGSEASGAVMPLLSRSCPLFP